jgi:hypothetical protein
VKTASTTVHSTGKNPNGNIMRQNNFNSIGNQSNNHTKVTITGELSHLTNIYIRRNHRYENNGRNGQITPHQYKQANNIYGGK